MEALELQLANPASFSRLPTPGQAKAKAARSRRECVPEPAACSHLNLALLSSSKAPARLWKHCGNTPTPGQAKAAQPAGVGAGARCGIEESICWTVLRTDRLQVKPVPRLAQQQQGSRASVCGSTGNPANSRPRRRAAGGSACRNQQLAASRSRSTGPRHPGLNLAFLSSCSRLCTLAPGRPTRRRRGRNGLFAGAR